MIISFSIVTFEPDLQVLSRLFLCLQKAIDKARQDFPMTVVIYLVDNSMTDRIEMNVRRMIKVEDSTTFHYIKTQKNIGYGAANNLAIKACTSDYHLVMNPDVFVAEDSLLQAIEYMQNYVEVGLLAPSVFGEDGDRHYLCKKNPTLFDLYLRSFAPNFLKRKFKQRMSDFEMRDQDYNRPMKDVPFNTGCFMFFRTQVLKNLGGFDERFFLHFEDADLSRRVLTISHSMYVPQVKIIHLWARESRKNLKMLVILIYSAILYFRKYGGVF